MPQTITPHVDTIETLHDCQCYDSWNTSKNQLLQVVDLYLLDCLLTPSLFRCCGHVVNITNIGMMSYITKIATVENATAIWEYDPSLPGNHVLGGSLVVINRGNPGVFLPYLYPYLAKPIPMATGMGFWWVWVVF